MNIWVCYPTANISRAVAARERWNAQGYQVAMYFNVGAASCDADYAYHDQYRGYWHACNQLARILFYERQADLVVYAADDIEPEKKHSAEMIGREYFKRFPDGLGVMQPCGDPQGDRIEGKAAGARICGSPWFGKAWHDRAYQGRGPTLDQYYHFYGDEDLKEVAEKQSLLWMRPDLVQFHRHWSWGHAPQQDYQKRNSNEHWNSDKELFERRKKAGFPGSEILPPLTPSANPWIYPIPPA